MALELAAGIEVSAVDGRTRVTLYVEQPVTMDELRACVRNLKETRFPAEDVDFWVHAVEPKKSNGPRLLVTKFSNIFTVDPYDDGAPDPAPEQSHPENDPFDLSMFATRSGPATTA